MEHLGLVGLPDSGHAQLFSALTGIDTPTGFETTKGVAPLPDGRVDRLAEMSKSKKPVGRRGFLKGAAAGAAGLMAAPVAMAQQESRPPAEAAITIAIGQSLPLPASSGASPARAR